jgi:crossover junction endodeoxyribonuclease RusA
MPPRHVEGPGRMITELSLPIPPSLNKYYRVRNGKPIISEHGRAYRKEVSAVRLLENLKPTHGRLAVKIVLVAPNNQRRDLDNILKCLLDAMAKAGLYADDSQIDRLEVVRGEVNPNNPRVDIVLTGDAAPAGRKAS